VHYLLLFTLSSRNLYKLSIIPYTMKKEAGFVVDDLTKKESSLDATKAIQFIKKHHLIFLLLIPIILSIFFRAYPYYLPITDVVAERRVHELIENNIRMELRKQFPTTDDHQLQRFSDQELLKYLDANKASVKQQINEFSASIKKNMQDDDGQTYLLAVDGYLWMQYAKNKIENGHYGTSLRSDAWVAASRDGVMPTTIDLAQEVDEGTNEWNDLRKGRLGKPVDTSKANSQVIVFVYNIMHFFGSNISVMGAAFLVPLLITTLGVIPVFFIARKIGGNIAGLFAGIIFAINRDLLTRTIAGFSDTDPYIVVLPLFISWTIIEAMTAQRRSYQWCFAVLAGLLIGVFSATWRGGWWATYAITIAALGIFIMSMVIKNKAFSIKKIKDNALLKRSVYITLIFLFVSGIAVTGFLGTANLKKTIQSTAGIGELKETKAVWPNVLTSVVELQERNFEGLINDMGGLFLVLIAAVGLGSVAWASRKEINHVFYTILFILWIILNLSAFTKGDRFAILMVPVFAIMFGIGIIFLCTRIVQFVSKHLQINRKVVNSFVFLIVMIILFAPLKNAHATGVQARPLINDAWVDVLEQIKDDGSDGIITSWWDFGHWFTAFAEKRVTFDGADQERRIYWVGKLLLTSSEKESIGILRMLNCRQNHAYLELEKIRQDPVGSVNILNSITSLNKEQARTRLQQEGLTPEQASTILERTHCTDLLPQYLITSEDMVGKAGAWTLFGNWDFDKADMYTSVKKMTRGEGVSMLVSRFNLTQVRAEQTYNDIQRFSANQFIQRQALFDLSHDDDCIIKEQKVECENSVHVDLTTMDTTLSIVDKGRGHPYSVVYVDNDEVKEKVFDNPIVDASVLLIPDDDSFDAIFAARPQGTSVFTKLFYFNGVGLKNYKLFTSQTDVNRQKIIAWKVDWDAD
jgi:dolichyl-phosphooligosaccharide-protein glycotransferase